MGLEQIFTKAERMMNRAIARGTLASGMGVKLAGGRTIPKVVMTSVAMAMVPIVRAELELAYNRSGLGRPTGLLFRTAVTEADIRIGPRGITAQFAAGKTGDNGRVYIYGNAWQHGAMHGAGGAKLKRTLKKAVQAGAKLSTHKYVAPKKFYTLTPDQQKRIQAEYMRLLDEKMAKYTNAAGKVA